jgi:hypothetical protein
MIATRCPCDRPSPAPVLLAGDAAAAAVSRSAMTKPAPTVARPTARLTRSRRVNESGGRNFSLMASTASRTQRGVAWPLARAWRQRLLSRNPTPPMSRHSNRRGRSLRSLEVEVPQRPSRSAYAANRFCIPSCPPWYRRHGATSGRRLRHRGRRERRAVGTSASRWLRSSGRLSKASVGSTPWRPIAGRACAARRTVLSRPRLPPADSRRHRRLWRRRPDSDDGITLTRR